MAGPFIRKVAVIGSGVMGSGIAAHIAGAGFPVLLLDIVPPGPAPAGVDAASPAWRSRFAREARERMYKSKPAAYHAKADAELIETGNLEDDLHRLSGCDWVIEAIKEELEVKRALYRRIDALGALRPVVTSNTSGLPIADLVQGLSEPFRRGFFVTHFFNPPRYMRLLELVRGVDTDPAVVERIARFGEEVLGKGIVYGRDTPNFIANRIGTFGMLDAIHEMQRCGLTPEEVDALLGTPVGHPKSALFRTGDMVGLDTFAHVAGNCHRLLTHDEERETFVLPPWVQAMVAAGRLGDKSRGGFYRKTPEGLQTLDPATGDYRPHVKARLPLLKELREVEDLRERLRAIAADTSPHGQFAWRVTARTLAYAARRLGEIAEDVTQIDRALRWGFNWELGPFEAWDALGFAATADRMRREGIALPAWVDVMQAAGIEGFYRNDGTDCYDPLASRWRPVVRSARSLRLPTRASDRRVVEANDSGQLLDMGEGVFCVAFRSKMNSVDPDNTLLLLRGIERAEQEGVGLVLGNEAPDAFCAGANLFLVVATANQAVDEPALWSSLEEQVRTFQGTVQRMRHASVPVVAAPFGLTLGGGCELALGAQAIRAHAELYMGLVEVGVGLIPGGGGTLELLWRLTGGLREGEDMFPAIQRTFETIGMAKVSMSAAEAREMGFLGPCDRVSFNREQLLFDARETVLSLVRTGHRPARPRTLRVGGTAAFANLQAGLWSMREAHQISEHDHLIALKLARVLTGGDVAAGTRRTEQEMLDLEREAFMSLLGEEKSRERMMHMLTTGKPLRN